MSKNSNGAEKAQKIILFLSDLKVGAAEQTYACPDGSKVVGTQTNEAPVKYLLGAYPGVCEVLCIVTEKVMTPVKTPEGIITTSLKTFQEMMGEQAPEVTVTPIEFKDEEDFANGPLAEIMSRVKKGDEILLDTTGGLRDAIMQLLLVSRALSFSGIPTVGAVYANYGAKQIVDCSHLIGLFDLVGGMQEMASFGSVKTLREYYGDKAEEKVKTLLDAMEGLQEDITLCRTGNLDRRIEAFNDAMKGAKDCGDPLVKALLPAFQDKFDKELNIPGLIHWCINSDMLQQALTLYKERIPIFILKDRTDDLVERKPLEDMGSWAQKNFTKNLSEKKDYETDEEFIFRRYLSLNWIQRQLENQKQPEKVKLKSSYLYIKCFADQLRDIIMDYQYIRMLRNMINHAQEQGAQSQRQQMEYLAGFGYKPLDKMGAEDIRVALERGLENLNKR